MPRELPILFKPDLVAEIRAGRKTETRRLVNPQPPRPETVAKMSGTAGYSWRQPWKDDRFMPCGDVWAVRQLNEHAANKGYRSPYGSKGDRLWVRTTWAVRDRWDDTKPRDIERPATVWYKADGEPRGLAWSMKGRWRPSIHMPRWACRDVVEVEEVRLEPLHKIDDAGALAEGVDRTNTSIHGYALERFRRLWESINGKREGASWDANPWVWVVRFRHLSTDQRTP